jgi:hypothetical protein
MDDRRFSRPAGVSPTALKPGMLVTVSPNKQTGDRSMASAIWQVVAINVGHALLVRHDFGDAADPEKERLVLLDEYEFYPADDLAAARQAGTRMN